MMNLHVLERSSMMDIHFLDKHDTLVRREASEAVSG